MLPLVVFAVHGHGVGFSPLGCFLHLARELLDALTHDLSRFEFHSRTRRNHEAAARLIRIASYTRLGQPRLENSEIAQLDRDVFCKTVCNVIKGSLDHLEDFVLNHSGLIADRDYNIALGKL